jgi:methyltransferase
MAAIPMVHTAWVTAVVFSLLNLVVLSVRLRAENSALETMGFTNCAQRREEPTS